jgi:hypothetical protein
MPGSTGPLRHCLGLDRRASACLQRTRHAGAHPEGIVRRVDDRLGHFGGDVAVGDLEEEGRGIECDQRSRDRT